MAPCAHAKGVTGAYLCIPIQAHGDALGLIHFQASNQATKFTEQEQLLSTTFAEQVGLSIANIRLREALRNQSIRDSVTGLFNRRYLEETLEREVHRAIRTGQTLGVIMLDLDHFKNFNDTFGHDAGDTVLRNTGEFLSKNIRADDIACRYGGGRVCINSAERQPGGYGVTGEKTEGFCESTKYQAPGQTFGDGYRVSGGRDISSARFHTDPADGRSRCRALPSKEDRPRQGGNCRTQLF
jgi:GGDEF domain-containing protein